MEASNRTKAELDARVLVLAPRGKDAELICRALEKEGPVCVPCQRPEELFDQAREGAGVVLVAIDALDSETTGKLSDLFSSQPPWSDLPIVLLAGSHNQEERKREDVGGNLNVLDLGTSPLAILTLVNSALAARRRQYRTRDLLQELSRVNQELERKTYDLEIANQALRSEAEERVLAEERNRMLASIVKSSNDAIIGTDVKGTITTWNNAAQRIFGYASEEILGRSITTLYPPESKGEEHSIFEAGFHGDLVENYETVRVAKDGRQLQVSLNVSPIKDLSGAIVGTSGIIHDISRLKSAEEELRRYTLKLEQSNRALQDFASIASHDLQEPLRKCKMFGDRLRARFGDSIGEEGKDYIERMHTAAERMQLLIAALLDYSRVTTRAQPHIPVDLNELLKEVLTDLEARIEETEGLVEFGNLPVIEGDPNQMRQLFQNLIGNALKFHGIGKPVVRISSIPCSSGVVQIEVRDNGIGFEERYAERIFAPFQRLHGRNSPYEGTGMGLAICKKIVERHGGTISAESKPGEGATFKVILPVTQAQTNASGYNCPLEIL